jgi:(4S)-4-hydroxy-5-phosphonooxypentane-2,3-dione isomerase
MSQQPVYTFAKWQVKEGQLDTVLSLLSEVAKESVKEKGNLFYKIHQSNTDKNTLILFEGYKDASAVEEHRNSSYFQNLVVGGIVPLLENREVILASEVEFE